MYVYFQIILQSDRFFTIEGKNYNFSYKVLQNFENVVTNFTTHTELGLPVLKLINIRFTKPLRYISIFHV